MTSAGAACTRSHASVEEKERASSRGRLHQGRLGPLWRRLTPLLTKIGVSEGKGSAPVSLGFTSASSRTDTRSHAVGAQHNTLVQDEITNVQAHMVAAVIAVNASITGLRGLSVSFRLCGYAFKEKRKP